MADEATLKDVTASPNPPVAADTPEPVKQEPVVAAAPDAEAAEIGRILLESGYTKDQLNDIMQAPTALASLRHLITDNPQELINLLDRTSPDASKKLLDTAADVYVKRYGKDDPKGSDTKGKEANSELMAEVESLRSELTSFRTQREQEQARMAMAQVKSRYDARVEDLFNQLPKDTGLTKAETKALRARVDAELAADPTIVQRVSTGNFVDVPHKFKAVIDEWSSDRKAAAQAADDRRKGIVSSASPEFSNGPNPFMPANLDFAGSWDDTEAAFAKALERAPRS
jgi:hypothetical protein